MKAQSDGAFSRSSGFASDGRVFSFSFRWLPWASAYFLALAVAVTWPLVLNLGTSIVGRYGDNLYFIWLIGWVRHSLFDLHASPFFTSMLNYPEGWALASTEVSPAQILLALPFTPLGPTLGYNVVALLSFVLSGLFSCIWVYRRSRSLWAGVIAGTIFSISPFRISHFLTGHLNLLGTQWIPLYFMALYELLDTRGRPYRWIWVAAAALGLIAFTSMYYLYMSLVLSAFFLLGVVLLLRNATGRRWVWTRYASAFAAALPLVLLAVLPSLQASSMNLLPVRSAGFDSPYSASPIDYMLPFTGHPFWGDWIGAHFNRDYWIEASLYIGIVAAALAVLGVVAGIRDRDRRGTTLHLLGIVIVAALLSMGPTLHWLSRPVIVELPPWLGWLAAPDSQQLLLPGSLLNRYLPFYSSMRVWMRYGVFASLFVAVLAGSGAAWLTRRAGPRLGPVLGLAVLGLCLFDFLPPKIDLTLVEGRPVDAWLRKQPAIGAVAQLPFDDYADSQDQIFYTLLHQKPYIGALYGSFPTPQYTAVRSVLEDFPSQASIEQLRDLGVRYVVVDDKWYDARDEMDDVHLALTRQGATHAVMLGGQHVYLLP